MAYIVSSSCRYGIRAATYLASLTDGSVPYVPIRKISDDLDISFHFLTKILQTLTQLGLVESYRGPNGGVALARPAKAITVIEIIKGIDGEGLFSGCILGLPHCSAAHPCALHANWVKERERLLRMFSSLTLAQLARSQAKVDG